MSYYGKRRYNPAADERRVREEKATARVNRDRARMRRLLGGFKKVKITGDEAQSAWGQNQIRTYNMARLTNGDTVISTVRSDGKSYWLQESDGMGWSFYKLVRIAKKRKRKLKRIGSRVILRKPRD